MREKKEECSPRNSPCSTCSPSAEGNTCISRTFSFVLLQRGQIIPIFHILPAWKGEGTPSPFPQVQVSTGMMLSERRAGSSGVNEFTSGCPEATTPRLASLPGYLDLFFLTKNSVSNQNELKSGFPRNSFWCEKTTQIHHLE